MLPPPVKGNDWASFLVPALIGLLGALIGTLGGGIATSQNLSAQARTQASQFEKERQDAQRALRTTAYLDFLTAFDQYNSNTGPYAACSALSPSDTSKDSICFGVQKSQAERLVALKKSQDALMTYGSDRVVTTVQSYFTTIDASGAQTVSNIELRVQTLSALLQGERIGAIVNVNGGQTTGIPGEGPNARRIQLELDQTLRQLDQARQGIPPNMSATEVGAIRKSLESDVCEELSAIPRSHC